VYNICETDNVYEVLTVMNIIKIAVLWDVTTHNLVMRYPQTPENCSFFLSNLLLEAVGSFGMLIPTYQI
jgi:hypothetical protein